VPGSSALKVVEGKSGLVLELELDELQAESESGQVVVVGELPHVVER
jgi:hypothetical protein